MLKILDLFCGAGGCSVGYARAGFKVVGVDFIAQPNYPYTFIQADALAVLQDPEFIAQFDFIHASPPCQAYCVATPTRLKATLPNLIEPTQRLLQATGKPYIIENVEGAAKAGLKYSIILAGTMFPELKVLRKRLFELSPDLAPFFEQPHIPKPKGSVKNGDYICVAGNGAPGTGKVHHKPSQIPVFLGKLKTHLHLTLFENREIAMQIDWIQQGNARQKMKQLVNAIPPPYTEWLGVRLMQVFTNTHVSEKKQLCLF
jgi:DNA (cytosine-5)-methyltransferase 1